MTKEITIDWRGGSRCVELQCPGRMKRLHHLATAPTPLKMAPTSLAWMNSTMVLGTGLDRKTVKSMEFSDGLGLLSEVLDYWGEIHEAEHGDEEDSPKSNIKGIELDDQGAVDVEDMR